MSDRTIEHVFNIECKLINANHFDVSRRVSLLANDMKQYADAQRAVDRWRQSVMGLSLELAPILDAVTSGDAEAVRKAVEEWRKGR